MATTAGPPSTGARAGRSAMMEMFNDSGAVAAAPASQPPLTGGGPGAYNGDYSTPPATDQHVGGYGVPAGQGYGGGGEYGAPPAGQGNAGGEYGAPAGAPTGGYGAPPAGQGYAGGEYGAPAGAPTGGYGAPPAGQGNAGGEYGAPAGGGYGAPPAGQGYAGGEYGAGQGYAGGEYGAGQDYAGVPAGMNYAQAYAGGEYNAPAGQATYNDGGASYGYNGSVDPYTGAHGAAGGGQYGYDPYTSYQDPAYGYGGAVAAQPYAPAPSGGAPPASGAPAGSGSAPPPLEGAPRGQDPQGALDGSSDSSIGELLRQGYSYGLEQPAHAVEGGAYFEDEDLSVRNARLAQQGRLRNSGKRRTGSAGKKSSAGGVNPKFKGYHQSPRSVQQGQSNANPRHSKNRRSSKGDDNHLPLINATQGGPAYAQRRGREVEYKPYTLAQYKATAAPTKLGGLGPDLENDQYRKKADAARRKKEYADRLRQQHRSTGLPVGPARSAADEPPAYQSSKTKAAKDYSKTVPKPRARPRSSDRGPHSSNHREVAVHTPIEAMELKHMIDLETVKRIREEFSGR